jgi:hypothetical protein
MRHCQKGRGICSLVIVSHAPKKNNVNNSIDKLSNICKLSYEYKKLASEKR